MTIGAKSDLTFFEENSSKLSLTFWVELTEKFELDWRDKFLTVRQQRLRVCFTPNIVMFFENLCLQVIKFLSILLFKKHWIIQLYVLLNVLKVQFLEFYDRVLGVKHRPIRIFCPNSPFFHLLYLKTFFEILCLRFDLCIKCTFS